MIQSLLSKPHHRDANQAVTVIAASPSIYLGWITVLRVMIGMIGIVIPLHTLFCLKPFWREYTLLSCYWDILRVRVVSELYAKRRNICD
jgi:hypothetical protein